MLASLEDLTLKKSEASRRNPSSPSSLIRYKNISFFRHSIGILVIFSIKRFVSYKFIDWLTSPKLILYKICELEAKQKRFIGEYYAYFGNRKWTFTHNLGLFEKEHFTLRDLTFRKLIYGVEMNVVQYFFVFIKSSTFISFWTKVVHREKATFRRGD